MKVELERIGDEPEKYLVRVAGTGMAIGIVTRTEPAAWSFETRTDEEQPDAGMTIGLHAATLDELRGVIERKFATLDEARERLTDNTMEEFATRVLLPLSSLGTSTKSISGLVNALGHQVAVIAASDIVPEKREEFFTRFIDRVREETLSVVREREGRQMWEQTMRSFLAKVVADAREKDGDDGPLKH
jgi:hypothetical protein